MTLVGLEEHSLISGFGVSGKQHLVSMMLSVQQQQQQYHGVHRGNVIVAPASQDASKAQQSQTQSAQQKRKMYTQTTPYSGQPASVAKRNARERNRVKQVNNGFATLRQHIPQTLAQALGNNTAGTHGGARAGSKKLSKVETLRMAVEYIRNLKQLLEEHDAEMSGSSSGSSAGSPKSSPGLEQEHQYQPAEIKFELKSESGDDEYQQAAHHYQHHHHQQHQQHQQQHLHFQRPSSSSPVYVPAPCSEASSSPTPSYVSEASSAGGSQGYGTNFNGTIYTSHQDPYFGEEPMSPEDEELLDCISLWQQGL